MSPWAAHFASGNVLFSGITLLVIAAASAWKPARKPSRRTRRLVILIGVPLIAASATPPPLPVVRGLGRLRDHAVSARSRNRTETGPGINTRGRCRCAAAFPCSSPPGNGPRCSPHHPAKTHLTPSTSSVIPSAPAWLTRRTPSGPLSWGASIRSMSSILRKRARPPGRHYNRSNELTNNTAWSSSKSAGNDMLSGLPSTEFDSDLTELLEALDVPGRQTILVELPLPPTFNEFGRVQRQRAREFGATLISKRLFVDVLSTRDATVDGVHLSPHGHQLMADRLWAHIEPFTAD